MIPSSEVFQPPSSVTDGVLTAGYNDLCTGTWTAASYELPRRLEDDGPL